MRPALALMMFTGLGPGRQPQAAAYVLQGRRHRHRAAARPGNRCIGRRRSRCATFWRRRRSTMRLRCAPTRKGSLGPRAGFGRPGAPTAASCANAGAIGPGLTLYGLRHTVAVILRECRLRRAHHRRRARSAHDRDGAALCQGCRSHRQDARRRQEIRARGEQAANKSVKPSGKVSNLDRQGGGLRSEKR